MAPTGGNEVQSAMTEPSRSGGNSFLDASVSCSGSTRTIAQGPSLCAYPCDASTSHSADSIRANLSLEWSSDASSTSSPTLFVRLARRCMSSRTAVVDASSTTYEAPLELSEMSPSSAGFTATRLTQIGSPALSSPFASPCNIRSSASGSLAAEKATRNRTVARPTN